MSDFKMGDRVTWTYRHHLNSKSSVTREKSGTIQSAVSFKRVNILGAIKTINDREHIPVLFDGNKKASKVKRLDIRRINNG